MSTVTRIPKVSTGIGKVLVVEDNELNLKLFKDLLESHGYDVLDTKDGTVAIDMIKGHVPDLIIMDIQLRGVSGFDIIQEIKMMLRYNIFLLLRSQLLQ